MMRTLIATTLTVAAAVLAPAATVAQPATIDTLISVEADGRLELHNGNGSVEIDTWDRAQVRLRARRSPAVPIRIQKKGVALVIQAPRQMERGATIEYRLTVPASMALTVHGMKSPVTVRGSTGRVEVHTLNGAIDIRGGRDRIQAHTVNGPVTIADARGRAEVNSVNGTVTLRAVTGEGISVNGVNGDVRLDGVDARSVEAVTVNGTIEFSGPIRNEGSYELNAHNGGIVFEVPEGTSARVHVSTFKGTLRTGFPVTIEEGPHGRQFDFTLGAGKARIELTSFNGTIELRRPGS